jgi:hypothetical protein
MSVSDKIQSLCQALDRADGNLDGVFIAAMRGVLADVLEQSRMLERGMVPVVRITPVDVQHVAQIARLHLAGVRTATADEVEGMASVTLLYLMLLQEHHQVLRAKGKTKKAVQS